MTDKTYRTKTGKTLTDADLDAIAARAAELGVESPAEDFDLGLTTDDF